MSHQPFPSGPPQYRSFVPASRSTAMRAPTLTLGARYIFPVEGAPISDGLLALREGRIAWLGPAEGRQADLDLGNVAITPGFVNAHTHLELSPVEGAPGGATTNGAEDELSWLRRVVEQ